MFTAFLIGLTLPLVPFLIGLGLIHRHSKKRK